MGVHEWCLMLLGWWLVHKVVTYLNEKYVVEKFKILNLVLLVLEQNGWQKILELKIL